MNGRTRKARSFLSPPAGIQALILASLAALLTLLAVSSCGKANPVAPTGSTLTLHVNPTTILSPRGSATATATLIRPNGTPDNGAQVQFTTTLGTFNPTVAATKSDGNAVSTLTGNGTPGTAKVTAFSGAVMSTELDVTIGGGVKTIILQAVPANIPASGGTAQLVALVRDATGLVAAGALVDFTTNVGRLSRLTDTTKANGEATTTLVVNASDITNQTQIMVSATAAGSDGSLQTAMATVSVLNPNAAASISVSANPGLVSISHLPQTITLRAAVLNSQGLPLQGANVIFSSGLGTLVNTGTVPTDKDGLALDTVQLSSSQVPAGTTQFMVTAQVPGAGGVLISGSAIVTVTP